MNEWEGKERPVNEENGDNDEWNRGVNGVSVERELNKWSVRWEKGENEYVEFSNNRFRAYIESYE
jgi:hypothetical protein